MVKRKLNKVFISAILVTSLVAAYQHHQTNTVEKSSVNTMSASRGQYKTEIYYNDYNKEQLEKFAPPIEPTPTPTLLPSNNSKKKDKKVNKCNIKQYKYKITDKEKEILERIVEAEATDRSLTAKENVCSVIINRVNSDEFPNDIESVVFQRSQFSPIGDQRYFRVKITKGTKEAVDNILKNGVTNDALFFCNPADVKSSRNKRWFKTLEYLFTDDAKHSFYK